MQDYLVFQLYAPLISWGTQAVGQERPIEDHPSRSALLGLLAAALGIDRQDDDQHEQISNACKFGVKQFAAGLVLRDFHTTQVPPVNKKVKHLYTRKDELNVSKLGTILSFRSYQQDSLNLVAVISNNPLYSCEKLKAALIAPHFHLYLGRKSCPPATPLNPIVIKKENLKQALDAVEPVEELKLPDKMKARYYWEQGMGEICLQQNFRVPRYDQPISRQRWQFSQRDEYVSLGE